ncbi:hypothetical protein HY086_03940 [Candidatus Gottesmanbacteria bacterium]|nr:hypothetical protein [Candidatus Gottesmanbacteria bacterium]
MKAFVLVILLLSLVPFLLPVHAACFTTAIGDKTNSAACTIAADTFECDDKTTNNTESGADNAVLTVSTAAITINSGSTGTTRLNVGSLSITSSGSISVGSSKVNIDLGTGCWVTDADVDGWAANFTLNTATASGKRRLGVMRHPSTTDCNDAAYSTTNTCWSYGYGQAWYYGYGQAWYYGYGQSMYWSYGYGESQYCSWGSPTCPN